MAGASWTLRNENFKPQQQLGTDDLTHMLHIHQDLKYVGDIELIQLNVKPMFNIVFWSRELFMEWNLDVHSIIAVAFFVKQNGIWHGSCSGKRKSAYVVCPA